MKITVVGMGHVSAVAAADLAKPGHEVVGVNLEMERI